MTPHISLVPLMLGMALGACANSGANVEPILDGVPTAAYASDLQACRTLAQNQHQFDQETAGAAVIGAAVGGVLGDIDDDGDALGGASATFIQWRRRRLWFQILCFFT